MSSNHRCLFMRAGIGFFCLGIGMIFLGCAESQPKSSPKSSPDPCMPAPPSPSFEALQQENERLRQQVETLSNLPEGVGISDLYQVASVQLTR